MIAANEKANPRLKQLISEQLKRENHQMKKKLLTGVIAFDSVVTERNGRIHRALTRLTVGYTLNNGVFGIYALVMKVLATNS